MAQRGYSPARRADRLCRPQRPQQATRLYVRLLWSPVSVMYTYQYQDLELYKATSGGDPTNYVWYVKKKSAAGDGDVIPGATTAKYRVPIHYRTSSATVTYDSNPVSLASDPTPTFCPKQRQRIINGIHSISRELASVV